MNAIEFIQAVKSEMAANWKNADMDSMTIELMVAVAAHYETCDECRQAFDDMGYEEEYLIELESLFNEHGDVSEWICEA
jgi:predicted anti-sigma-YlaC factor YlaD